MTDHSDLIERLRKPAPKFGLEEFDQTYDVRQEAASALSSQSLSLSGAREEIERLRGLLNANGKPRFNEAMRRLEAAEHEARVHSDAADGYRDELLSLRASLRKGAEEIEVTDEMIEAGKEAANGWTDRYMDGAEFVNWDEALPEIFRRMLALVSGSREDGE